MSTMKIEGLNLKEQKLYNVLKDGKAHDVREMKKLFWNDAKEHCGQVYEKGWGEGEIDSQAQSYVRNSVRRLVRDGWCVQVGRGTYQFSKKGMEWVKQGVAITASAKKEAKPKKVKTPKVKKEAKPKKEKVAKAPKVKVESVKKVAAPAPKNGDSKAAAKQKAKEAALRAAKGAAKQKAAEASARATNTIKEETSAE